MRKTLLYLFVLMSLFGYAQSPQKINYQAVARDASGNIVTTAIGIKFRILQGSASGTLVYEETHTSTPSSAGIFNVAIGGGSATFGTFSSIAWQSGPYFLEVNIDPNGGTSYTTVGANQFVSVPYALYAEKTGSVPSPTLAFNSGVLTVGTNTVSVPSGSYSAGNGIAIGSGSITNTAPDQTVTITPGTSINVLGTYPNFTISSTGTMAATPNTSITGTGLVTVTPVGTNTFAISVPSPTLIGAGSTSVTGTYPTFTISTPTATATNWSILGNAGTVDGTNFLGTTDANPLNFRVNNVKAGRIDTSGRAIFGYLAANSNINVSTTAFGHKALFANTSGSLNAAFGKEALYNNATGNENVAFGYRSLYNNSVGNYNSAFGVNALLSNIGGWDNSAFGNWALRFNTTGGQNSAFGSMALMNNTGGGQNTAFGYYALGLNSTGSNNVAIGNSAMYASATASNNVAIGVQSQYSITVGLGNTSVGYNSLRNNSTGFYSNAFGYNALRDNIAGFNLAYGADALVSNTTGTANIGIGNATFSSNISGMENTGVGFAAGQFNTGSGNVFIGNKAGQNEIGSNKLYIANTNTAVPLIYGDFSTSRIGLGTNAPSYKLHVTETTSLSVIGAISNYNATATPLFGVYASVNNPNTTSAAVYGTHSGGGNGVSGISTATTFTGTAGVYGLTMGTQSSNASIQADANSGNSTGLFVNGFSGHTGVNVLSIKTGNAGNNARFETNNTANNADAVFATTNGTGSVMHLVNTSVATGTVPGQRAALWIEEGHIRTSQAVKPTIALGTALTGGANTSINGPGTDVAGEIYFNAGTVSGTSPFYLVAVTFNKPYTSPPIVILQARNQTAASLQVYVSSTNTGFFVYSNNAPANASNYQFNYLVIEK